jgi:hypothetical protein
MSVKRCSGAWGIARFLVICKFADNAQSLRYWLMDNIILTISDRDQCIALYRLLEPNAVTRPIFLELATVVTQEIDPNLSANFDRLGKLRQGSSVLRQRKRFMRG